MAVNQQSGGNASTSPFDLNSVARRDPNTIPMSNTNGSSSNTESDSCAADFEDRGRESTDTAPNPFDPAKLRLSQDFASATSVRKVLTTIPCRKPSRHEFVRVRTGAEWRLETGVFEDKLNREVYLVDPSLWSGLLGEVYPVCLFCAVTRQNDLLLWPVKLPGPDGKSNSWNDSALAAATLAESKWVRLAANMPGGIYNVYEAEGALSDPEWPDLAFHEILRLAFKARFIQSLDHPVVKALRGEV